ncbi:PQQ-dependent sugar dehydrogenase [Edaphobacter bradus]|uniref:PQQ-dependent sugar dehydrogenase n=1 Tax=Edaphobacter bradus TaxID=2259016 RepID=UPI0021E0EAFA|nr:sorbosone dehydrogenase family protein [Edaphobacter bradus]
MISPRRTAPASFLICLYFAIGCSNGSSTSSTTTTMGGSGTSTMQANAGCIGAVQTGSAAFIDYTKETPGACRHLTPADLPQPNTASSVTNGSTLVARVNNQLPQVPSGFTVQQYATGLNNPRLLATAPNGDIFVAEPAANNVVVLRGVDATGKAQSTSTFASGLNALFGIAFYPVGASPQYVYVANVDSVVRFPYQSGDTQARGAAQVVVATLPHNGGHSTRTLAFTSDNRLLVSVGSAGNVTNTDTDTSETNRADVLAYTPDGTFLKIYASGLRNAVGLAVNAAGAVWVSVNERDGLGDNLPPDFVTHIQEGGFYGWPWYYIGANPDPSLPPSHPELAAMTIVPDTLLQPHFAPLQIAFYTGSQFPAIYNGDIFVAAHGSWNRSIRSGYELLRVLLQNGTATGVYEDFMTGFVNADGTVWGRPVGVTVGSDGALYVSDDASNSVWRIAYTGS